jgi:hypothetical protein
MMRIERGDARAGLVFFRNAARRGGPRPELAAWTIVAHVAEGRHDKARKVFRATRAWPWPACLRRARRALGLDE